MNLTSLSHRFATVANRSACRGPGCRGVPASPQIQTETCLIGLHRGLVRPQLVRPVPQPSRSSAEQTGDPTAASVACHVRRLTTRASYHIIPCALGATAHPPFLALSISVSLLYLTTCEYENAPRSSVEPHKCAPRSLYPRRRDAQASTSKVVPVAASRHDSIPETCRALTSLRGCCLS